MSGYSPFESPDPFYYHYSGFDSALAPQPQQQPHPSPHPPALPVALQRSASAATDEEEERASLAAEFYAHSSAVRSRKPVVVAASAAHPRTLPQQQHQQQQQQQQQPLPLPPPPQHQHPLAQVVVAQPPAPSQPFFSSPPQRTQWAVWAAAGALCVALVLAVVVLSLLLHQRQLALRVDAYSASLRQLTDNRTAAWASFASLPPAPTVPPLPAARSSRYPREDELDRQLLDWERTGGGGSAANVGNGGSSELWRRIEFAIPAAAAASSASTERRIEVEWKGEPRFDWISAYSLCCRYDNATTLSCAGQAADRPRDVRLKRASDGRGTRLSAAADSSEGACVLRYLWSRKMREPL